jgi:hypothetical protein
VYCIAFKCLFDVYRLLVDDGRGVGEALNEPGVDGKGLRVRGTHVLSIDASPSTASLNRVKNQQNQMFKPLLFFAPQASVGTPRYSFLAAPLPSNVHLVTVQAQAPGQVFIRLAHLGAAGDNAGLAANATVSLATLFPDAPIKTAVETTLNGVQALASTQSYTYKYYDPVNPEQIVTATMPVVPAPPSGASLSVTLSQMQVRAFQCTY